MARANTISVKEQRYLLLCELLHIWFGMWNVGAVACTRKTQAKSIFHFWSWSFEDAVRWFCLRFIIILYTSRNRLQDLKQLYWIGAQRLISECWQNKSQKERWTGRYMGMKTTPSHWFRRCFTRFKIFSQFWPSFSYLNGKTYLRFYVFFLPRGTFS